MTLLKKTGGFSFIEILVVISIMAIVASYGALNLFGVFQKIALDSEASKIAFTLRSARDRAIFQENSDQWGVHFENNGAPFYAFFQGGGYATSTNIVSRNNLDGKSRFVYPASDSSHDVVFSKVYGLPSNTNSIIISSISDSSKQKVITINLNGEVGY